MAKADVIAAIASAPGLAAIGVVRLSGPDLQRFMLPLLARELPPRTTVLSEFLDRDGGVLDVGIAIFFPAPRSYTGEDVIELQGHGGTAVVQLVLRRCLELGARLAQPGEFTRRAFMNGKLDLAQAESVADLIEAGSEAAARAALRSLKGEFSKRVDAVVAELVEIRVLVEASMDFPDEDVGAFEALKMRARLRELSQIVSRILGSANSGRLLRDGAQVVLVGGPNVGKSSLLNRLADEDVAIVTEIPGTTRDTVRSELILEGVPIHVVDTAGLRETQDPVERIGIERTWAAAREADIVLTVVDVLQGRSLIDEQIVQRLPFVPRRISVLNKIDLSGHEPGWEHGESYDEVRVSAKTGAGLDLLRGAILGQAGWTSPTESIVLARARHVEGLAKAERHLESAQAHDSDVELMAEELRLAHRALAQLVGEFTTDDLLGEIFSRFCIGK